MPWQEKLNGDSLSWLMEEDEPGVRYLAMRDLLDLPAKDPAPKPTGSASISISPIRGISNTVEIY